MTGLSSLYSASQDPWTLLQERFGLADQSGIANEGRARFSGGFGSCIVDRTNIRRRQPLRLAFDAVEGLIARVNQGQKLIRAFLHRCATLPMNRIPTGQR